MKNEQTVIEPGIVTTEIPKERNRTDNGHTGAMACVILLNNNETVFSYVVFCLVEVDFGLSHGEADSIMWKAHCAGQAVVGYYSREVAGKLLDDVIALNRKCGQQLGFTIIGNK